MIKNPSPSGKDFFIYCSHFHHIYTSDKLRLIQWEFYPTEFSRIYPELVSIG